MRNNLNKWKMNNKIAMLVGISTSCGLLYYEKRKIERYLNHLINSNVLDAEKKRPDYIYIKYHIYKESMRKLKMQQEADANWINIIINPIGKWWKTFKHSIAWRLLNIAQNGDKSERLKAVRQLAQIDHLKDWDFRHLAQICDARTAVSLARSECDSRWFVPVHNSSVIKNPKLVLNDLHKMLETMKPNSCIEHFFRKYFPDQDIKESDFDEFHSQGEETQTAPNYELLKECISFLHHLTKDEKSCEKIIKQGGLVILLELKKIFAKDYETLATLCKTMANISLAKNCLEDFFVTGWITVLAEWRHHPDIRLQVIAAKTLANLDYDDIQSHQYPPNVYPLYPKYRQLRKTKADVVFIHGLLGSVFITWRQKDREYTELGLYGKNAFYTNEADDVFIVGESKRNGNSKKITTTNKKDKENMTAMHNPIIHSKIQKASNENKLHSISDVATKELVEIFEQSAELGNDWEVVHPDCPLKASENCDGEFSVSGDKWHNDDANEDYTNCWPMDWLPDDFPNVRILGIDYTSAVTEWSSNYTKYCPCEKDQGHLDNRSSNLLERLVQSNVGENRPVIWIGHSMGGVLTKHIILKSLASNNEKVQQVGKNTKGILFLGTPHRGSVLAKWKQHMQMIISPSIEVKEMEENEPKLLELHNKFMHCIRNNFKNLEVVSIAEGEPTMLTTFKFPLRIVTEESAFLNYGDFYVLKDDHLSLSKPIFKQSFLYQRLLKVIDKSMNTTPVDGNFVSEKPQLKKLKTKKSLWSYIPGFWFNKFLVQMEGTVKDD